MDIVSSKRGKMKTLQLSHCEQTFIIFTSSVVRWLLGVFLASPIIMLRYSVLLFLIVGLRTTSQRRMFHMLHSLKQ